VLVARTLRLALALGFAALAAGCATPVSEDVFSEGPVKVTLRSQKRWQFGSLIEKNYDHPVTISAVRITHILSRIDMRRAGKREPAIPTDMLFGIGEGVARALQRAGSEQEVVVMANQRSRRLGIFDHDYLTSFVCYVQGPQLFIHINRVDWEVPQKDRDDPPQPKIGEHRMDFRVYPSEAMELVDTQSVAVVWADDIFAQPTRTKVLPTGRVVRKTILLESPEDETAPSPVEGEEAAAPKAPEQPAPVAPSGLTPAQLRALADLEEARRDGKITEAEYAAEQQKIVSGESTEAPATP
jgi:hypothetical protein